jgi:hypothetical protein
MLECTGKVWNVLELIGKQWKALEYTGKLWSALTPPLWEASSVELRHSNRLLIAIQNIYI